MTGGILPKYFDTVIPIEKIDYYPNEKKPKFIIIDKKINKNDHVRFSGSDYKKGEKVISRGEIVNSSHIMAFKTLGIEKISVKNWFGVRDFSKLSFRERELGYWWPNFIEKKTNNWHKQFRYISSTFSITL